MFAFIKREEIREKAFRKTSGEGVASFFLAEPYEKLTQEQMDELQEMVDEARKKLESGDWRGGRM